MHDDIRQANFTTKPRFENANFIVNKFQKQQRWKECPRENNTKVPEVWENFAQTRLGGEIWACDVIMLHELLMTTAN